MLMPGFGQAPIVFDAGVVLYSVVDIVEDIVVYVCVSSTGREFDGERGVNSPRIAVADTESHQWAVVGILIAIVVGHGDIEPREITGQTEEVSLRKVFQPESEFRLKSQNPESVIVLDGVWAVNNRKNRARNGLRAELRTEVWQFRRPVAGHWS